LSDYREKYLHAKKGRSGFSRKSLALGFNQCLDLIAAFVMQSKK